jgi:hypothetical protein
MKMLSLKTAVLAFAPVLAAAHPVDGQSQRVAPPAWTRDFDVRPLGAVCAITHDNNGVRQSYELVESSLIQSVDRTYVFSVNAGTCAVTRAASRVTCSYDATTTNAPRCTRPAPGARRR